MWIVYAFISAFAESTKDITGKVSSQKTNEYLTAFGLQAFSAIVLAVIVVFTGIPVLKTSFWLALVGLSISIPLWSVLYMKAIKLSPLSVSIPMLAFNPVFTALLAIVFLNKIPTTLGWLGMVLIGIGLYISRLSKDTYTKGVFYPIMQLANEPGALAMLGVSLIWSVGAYISRMAVLGSSAIFAAFAGSAIAAVILYLLNMHKGVITLSTIKENIKYFSTLGVLNALSDLMLNMALATGFVPYVISIKRTNMLWSSLVGFFFFKERLEKFKVFGLLLMFSGVILTIVLG